MGTTKDATKSFLKSKIVSALLLLWQLPQFLLGIFVLFSLHKKISKKYFAEPLQVNIYQIKNFNAGVSFGPIIIMGRGDSNDVLHELGHSKQSRYLGPLYLVVVGIPSVTMNLMSRFSKKFGKGEFSKRYYQRFPENLADELGGVQNRKVGV